MSALQVATLASVLFAVGAVVNNPPTRFLNANFYDKDFPEKKVKGKLNIQTNYLPIVSKPFYGDEDIPKWKAVANDWKIKKIGLIFVDDGIHTAIKIEADHKVTGKRGVYDKKGAAVMKDGQQVTENVEYTPTLLWEYNSETWNSYMFEIIKGVNYAIYPSKNTLAYIEDPRELKEGTKLDTQPMTFGRLLECVDEEGIPNMLGSCMAFSLKVFRFATGDCKCGECAPSAESLDDPLKYPAIGANAKKRIQGATEGFKLFKAKMAEQAKMIQSSVFLRSVLYWKPGSFDAGKAVVRFNLQMHLLFGVDLTNTDFDFLEKYLEEPLRSQLLQELERKKGQIQTT